LTGLIFRHVGFGGDTVGYEQAWEQQRRLHAARVADEIDDVVLLLEHSSVYTAGKRTDAAERPVDGTEVVDVDRGGKTTWHGPGQLVGYPIVKLPRHVYVVDYVRRLEEALIRSCAGLGLPSGRVKGRSGVWRAADGNRPERKVAALGVRVSQGVTMHGVALTSLSAELGRDVTVSEALPYVERHLADLLSWSEYDRSPDLPSVEPSEMRR